MENNTWKVGDIIQGVHTSYKVGIIKCNNMIVRCLFLPNTDTPSAIIWHIADNDWVFFDESYEENLWAGVPRILNSINKDKIVNAEKSAREIMNQIQNK